MQKWTVSIYFQNQAPQIIKINEGSLQFNNHTSPDQWAVNLSNSYGWNLSSFLIEKPSQLYYGFYIENISGNATLHLGPTQSLVLAISNSCIS